MTAPRLVASALIIQYLLLALLYGFSGDLRRCCYWIAASVLTASVTY